MFASTGLCKQGVRASRCSDVIKVIGWLCSDSFLSVSTSADAMESSCSLCLYLHVNQVLNKNKAVSKKVHQLSGNYLTFYFYFTFHFLFRNGAKQSLLSDVLVDGIFLQIFDYLDENDLENCENVCRRWQKLIQNHTWKKLLHVKVVERFFGVDFENFSIILTIVFFISES